MAHRPATDPAAADLTATSPRPPRTAVYVLIFAVLAVTVGLIGYFTYVEGKAALRQEKQADLAAIALLKTDRITAWLAERRSDSKFIAKGSLAAREFEYWLALGAPQDERHKRLLARLRAFISDSAYHNAWFLDREAEVRLTVDPAHAEISEAIRNMARQAMEKGETVISDLYLKETAGAQHGHVDFYVVAPLRVGEAESERIIGAVVLLVDPSRFLFPFLQSWPAPSPSAETLLIQIEDDQVIYLNEPRHSKKAPLTRMPLRPDSPAAFAARGKSGEMEGRDYRGVPVIASVHAVPGTRWHMVSKMDTEEAYAHLSRIALRTTAITALFMAVIAIMGVLWWRQGRLAFALLKLRAERLLEAERIEVELARLEWQTVFDAISDPIFLHDGEFRITRANLAYARAVGMDVREVIGQPYWKVFPHREGPLDSCLQALHNQTEKDEEFEADGRIYFSRGFPAQDSTSARYSVHIMEDITERKRVETEISQLNDALEEKVAARTADLERAKLEAEQANRGKDEFLAAISHELKTPLNHILGFSDLLKEGLAGELNAEQRGMAQDIFDAGSKQLAIVNSLIELARLQVGKVELQARPEDPARMLGEIATRHAAKAQAAGLAFAVEVAEGLGEMPLDREVVTQLLDRLLENAFKFTPTGGKVSLIARRVPRTKVAAPVRIEADEYLELAVADNGPGIAPEILPRLFQPFVQGDGRLARNHQGTGIGLVLVRLLAELHGGGSGVESKPGAGAKFLIWLPCGAADMEVVSPPSQPSPVNGGRS